MTEAYALRRYNQELERRRDADMGAPNYSQSPTRPPAQIGRPAKYRRSGDFASFSKIRNSDGAAVLSVPCKIRRSDRSNTRAMRTTSKFMGAVLAAEWQWEAVG